MTSSADLHDLIKGQNLPKRFLANLAARPETPVVKWKAADGSWESLTLAEVADHAARLTTGLKKLGVKRGDRVVLMMANRQEFHALDLAVLFCGATPVSIYNSSAPNQIEYLVNNCGASVAILEGADFLERFNKVKAEIPTLQQIAVIDTDETMGDDIIRYSDLLANEPADLAAAAGRQVVDTGEPADGVAVMLVPMIDGPIDDVDALADLLGGR